MLIDSLDSILFLLLEVAYTLGFYINLLSTNRAANAGIFLRSKDSLLKEADSTPIYCLNRKSSVYLIRWDTTTLDSIPTPTSGLHSANQVSSILSLTQDLGKFALSSLYELK